MMRIALRSLCRKPGFSAIVIVTLALGIGANVTLFSVVDAVLLESLPFAGSDDLVLLWERNYPRERRTNVVSPANFIAWKEQADSFTDMVALTPGAVTLTGEHAPMRMPSARVSDRFFSVLGVDAHLGRVFSEQDSEHVTVLDYRAWQTRFGGDPDVIGATVRLSDVDHTVIGVMPEAFRFELDATQATLGIEADFWRPLRPTEEWRDRRGRYLLVLARKSPRATYDGVQAEMDTIAARLERDHPGYNTGWGVTVVPLTEQMVGTARPTLWLLFASVGVMLLLACINIANLLVGRGIARRREIAIRTALGAGTGHIASQLLLESLMMTLAACSLGLGFAVWAVSAIERYSPISIPRLDTIAVDGGALVFALALCVSTAVLFGILPALQARNTDVQSVLRGASWWACGGVSSLRFRSALVALELAIAVVLLAASGVLVRTLVSYDAVDPGFERSGALTMKLSLPEARYVDDGARLTFFDELRERLDNVPDIDSVSVVSSVPLSGPHAATRVHAGDRPPPADGESPVADIRIIAGDYFRSMGIPLVTGRNFDRRDTAEQPLRAILSLSAAETLWPGVAATELIGKVVQISWGEIIPYEIVGVVGDVHHAALSTRPRSMIYWSHHQRAWGAMSLVVRGGGLPLVQSEIWALDPALPVYDVRAIDELVSASVATERLSATLFASFALAALVVASLGIYGVVGFFVSQRNREMGLRLALGASPLRVMLAVMGQGMTMTLVGVAVGVGAAGFTMRYMGSLLFGVRPFDPLTIATVCSVLTGVALVASYLPARRASRLDPARVLRSE